MTPGDLTATPTTRPRRFSLWTAAAGVTAAVAVLAGLLVGAYRLGQSSEPGVHRDFLFQINGLHSPNQRGHTVNLVVAYRYPAGIAEKDLPNYIHLRRIALAHLTAGDFPGDPYWETVNQELCSELKDRFPISAISCQLQLPGVTERGDRYQPGWHSSTHTIGAITPLAVPGPVTAAPES